MADDNSTITGIEVRNLSKAYGRRTVLKGISCRMENGESIALIGRNGAGKTTFLSIISGASSPDSGEVLINGFNLTKRSERLAARRYIGFLPHDLCIYEELTASENLEYFGLLWGIGGKDLRERIEKILDEVGLSGSAKKASRAFSRGMKQRLAIARVILTNPPIWIMDEPFTGLDAQGRKWLSSLLSRESAAGRLILFSTLSEGEVLNAASRIMAIRNGKIFSDSVVTPEDTAAVRALFSAGMEH